MAHTYRTTQFETQQWTLSRMWFATRSGLNNNRCRGNYEIIMRLWIMIITFRKFVKAKGWILHTTVKHSFFNLFADHTASGEEWCDLCPRDLPVGKWPCKALVVESDSFCVSDRSHNNRDKPRALSGKNQIVWSSSASGKKHKHRCLLQASEEKQKQTQ